MKTRTAISFIVSLLVSSVASALPVFPTATGFGSDIVAGRGGAVYRVTNLNDSGPGSLRDGVQKTEGSRVIVFELSGVIELKSELVVPPSSVGDFGHLTVAGQTAPPPGITLKNAGITVQNSDVLIQHLAIRPDTSDSDAHSLPSSRRDGITIEAPRREAVRGVVIDHVSCSWATDGTVSAWSDAGAVQDVTFSHCIFSEPIRRGGSNTPESVRPVAGRNTMGVSFLENVIVSQGDQRPFIGDRIVLAQIVNNFFYRVGPRSPGAIHLANADPERPDLTLIASVAGNVVIDAPAAASATRSRSTVSPIGVYLDDRITTGLILHLANNSLYDPDAGKWLLSGKDPYGAEICRVGPIVPKHWTSNPFPATRVTPWTDEPQQIEKRLMPRAGKQPAFRDAIDSELIETIGKRAAHAIATGEKLHEQSWRSVDVHQTRVLELPASPNGDDDNDGYTNLEEWLHGWSDFVEGSAPQPPTNGDIAQLRSYQTPGVQNDLPVFYQRLKDRISHPLSWTTGSFSNFDDWKKLAREKVKSRWLASPPAAPWKPTLLAQEDRGTYVVRKIVFNVTGDSRVLAYLAVPKGKGPFPAVLLMHDHGGRYDIGKEKVVRPIGVSQEIAASAAAWVERDYGGRYLADTLAERGYVCFVTDALNWGDRGGGAYAGQQAIASNLMHLGMSFAGLMAWEDMRAADFLAEQPEVDARRIAAMGLSMGAYRAWQVSAMSDHITAGVAICWMTEMKSLFVPGNNQVKGTSAYSMLHPGLLADLDYPDIASLACPKPMLFYNGRYDRLFPVSGVQGAYAKMQAVWKSQGALDRLHTKIWDVEHVFNAAMQDEAFAWLDQVLNVRSSPPKK